MKLHDQNGSKVFINICHSLQVDKAEGKPGKDGTQAWTIPHNLGPPRMEKDKSGVPALTFDMVIHSDALTLAAQMKPFKDMICKVRRAAVTPSLVVPAAGACNVTSCACAFCFSMLRFSCFCGRFTAYISLLMDHRWRLTRCRPR